VTVSHCFCQGVLFFRVRGLISATGTEGMRNRVCPVVARNLGSAISGSLRAESCEHSLPLRLCVFFFFFLRNVSFLAPPGKKNALSQLIFASSDQTTEKGHSVLKSLSKARHQK